MPAGSELDLTVMTVLHDALRRELEHLARATVRFDADPRTVLRTAAGWRLFKTALYIHHAAEDQVLWPPLRAALAGRPSELALLEAMEAEHAGVDQVIAAIDQRLAEPAGPDRLGDVCLVDLVDSLATGLTAHLKHEEDQALPLIRAVATAQQWARFRRLHSGWQPAYAAPDRWSVGGGG